MKYILPVVAPHDHVIKPTLKFDPKLPGPCPRDSTRKSQYCRIDPVFLFFRLLTRTTAKSPYLSRSNLRLRSRDDSFDRLLTRGGQSVLVQAVRNCREAADWVSRPANAPTTYVCRGDRCFASMLSRCALTAAGKMQRMQSTIHNEYIRWCDRRYIVLLLVIHDSGPGACTAVIETGAFIS